VHELVEVVEASRHLEGRGRDEPRNSLVAASDEVLIPTELAGALLAATNTRHEALVELPEQAETEWESRESAEPVPICRQVVQNLLNVWGDLQPQLCLRRVHVRKRCHRPLDP
jgi:hypothetical protein